MSTPDIALDLADSGQPSIVVRGLSRRDLSALASANLSNEGWTAALRIAVVPDDGVPVYVAVAGRYAVAGGVVRFTSLYPLDAGRRYKVDFNPAASSAGLAGIPSASRVVRVPAGPATAPTTVTAVYPTGPNVPANLLRMYVEFSGAMGSRTGQDYISILDAAGAELRGALLPLDTDLWNGEHTRFTVLFDPGRVKRGILPNRAMGRPLREGGTFTLVVKPGWPDAHGKPLAAEFRKAYRVEAAIERPLDIAEWRLAAPAAGTREPLRVTFPAPLDHGLVQRALAVFRGEAAIAGDVAVTGGETEWRFVPRDAWRAGGYAMTILPVLEDPSGNRINHAFETVSPDDDTHAAPWRLPFTIR